MDFNFISKDVSSHLGWRSSDPSDHGRVDSLEFFPALFLALGQIYKVKGFAVSQWFTWLLFARRLRFS